MKYRYDPPVVPGVVSAQIIVSVGDCHEVVIDRNIHPGGDDPGRCIQHRAVVEEEEEFVLLVVDSSVVHLRHNLAVGPDILRHQHVDQPTGLQADRVATFLVLKLRARGGAVRSGGGSLCG